MRDRPMRECTLRCLHLALKRWQWGPAPGDAPGDSWLRAIRVALGMTSRQLAARLGVSEPAVRSAERAEKDGSISLATLRRARSGHWESDRGEIRWARHGVFSQNLSRLWKVPADAKPHAAPTGGRAASAHTP